MRCQLMRTQLAGFVNKLHNNNSHNLFIFCKMSKLLQLAFGGLRRFNSNLLKNPIRQYVKAAYEGDGKTKVSIFNTEQEYGLMITGFSQYGFRLNNDMSIIGPMAIFPRSVLSWNVNTFEDINENSLSFFCTLEPKIDILIIGIGDQPVSHGLSKVIIEFMKKHKINVEILRTEQACATFNFLNAENRMVASALIPPLHISYNENDILQSKLRHKELYEVD